MKKKVADRDLSDEFYIASAATSAEEIWNGQGSPVYPRARAELQKHGISCEGKCAVQLRRSDYDEYDYLIGMEDMNIRDIEAVTGHKGGKIRTLLSFAGSTAGIRDPWYSRRFDEAYSDIDRGCEALLEYLMGLMPRV